MKAPPEAAPPAGRRRAGPPRGRVLLAGLLALACLPVGAADAANAADEGAGPGATVRPNAALLQYRLQLNPGRPEATARIRVTHRDGTFEWLELRAGADSQVSDVTADGKLSRQGERLRWTPPAGGGELRYQVGLDRRRSNGAHDALVTDRYALFRGDDAFPVARLRYRDGARITSEVAVQVPPEWTVVLPYRSGAGGRVRIRNPVSGGNRPVGWIIAGELGVRREEINGVDFSIAAPRGQRVERLAMLALLRWSLPELMEGLPAPPGYVSIVSAGDPFWLGALSAPNSIFVHRERPLISENGTSTLLHEVTHILLTPLDTVRDQDWIDEGLAEYLSLRALVRSGTLSAERFEAALAGFERRGAAVKSLRTVAATGAVTARAVTLFRDLDRELQQASDGRLDLTDLVAALIAQERPVDLDILRQAAAKLMGRPARALADEALPRT